MRQKRPKTGKYRFAGVLSFVAGSVLLVAVLFSDLFSDSSFFSEATDETLIVILILMALVPLLFFLLAYWIGKWGLPRPKREYRMLAPEAPAPTPSKEEPAEDEPAEARFAMLTEIDRRMRSYRGPENEVETLTELCEDFRNYAAGRLHLYYDLPTIRQFFAGMAVSHILIMQGMSGTGKTSLAFAFGEYLRNTSTIVPVQPMWKERSDLLGYYNEFTKKFNETVLLQKIYEANYSQDLYITVLDEMNIARVEYYFAEFLSLLEIPELKGRQLQIMPDQRSDDPRLLRDGMLQLPENMWFIGTANNDDSTFAISDKVYDRAMILNLNRKAEVFHAEETGARRLSMDNWKRLVADAQREYALTRRSRGRIRKLDAYLGEHYRISFGNRIMKQIEAYVPAYIACGGTEAEALDDIFAKKVLRKLESLNPVYVRNSAENLRQFLDDLFGQGRMASCLDYLNHLEKTI